MTTTRYLIIDKVNEVYLKIEAEADIRRELGEYFTFEVPGYKFMPQYRNRVWDGKIRLFSYATGKIYAGLYPYIKNWCKENDIHVVDGTKIKETSVDDNKLDLPNTPNTCLLYTSPSPRDRQKSRMPSSA